jgi:hypothetical protein
VGELVGLEAVFLLSAALVLTLVLASRIVTNEAIEAAEREGDEEAARLTADMGTPALPLDKATHLAAELEDEALIRNLDARG